MRWIRAHNRKVLRIAILRTDLMGDEELQAFLSYSRHEISENVARGFKIRSLA